MVWKPSTSCGSRRDVTGGELDGRVSMDDVGLGKMVSTKKDFVGKAMSGRTAFTDPNRVKMIGLVATEADERIIGGGIVFDSKDGPFDHTTMLGYVTSAAAFSLLKTGRSRWPSSRTRRTITARRSTSSPTSTTGRLSK